MKLHDQLRAYQPFNEQEARDCGRILQYMDAFDNIFSRDNALCHMTASAWVVNPARDRVLMAYHNIYQAWTWLGGHADGECCLHAVALREAEEETGVRARPVQAEIFSVEILPVPEHVKRGKTVRGHVHLNVTYLLEAPQDAFLRAKPDENSGVKWRLAS